MEFTIKERQPIELDNEMRLRIETWETENRFYGLFPIVGESMQCDGDKNILDGSKVLVSECDFSHSPNPNHELNAFSLPLLKPLIFQLDNGQGRIIHLCKEIGCIDLVSNKIKLLSNNREYGYKWFPLSSVKRVFEIQQIFNNSKLQNA